MVKLDGKHWAEFDDYKLRENSEKNLIQDLNTLINDKDFKTHKGYLKFPSLAKYFYLIWKSKKSN